MKIMKAKSSTSRPVFASVISLVLCVAMFLGTTLAWFTDTVTNTNNRIAMGELNVGLLMDKALDGNYVDISNSDKGDIFSEATGNGVRWEPSKTEIVFLQVANKGDLALNYNIMIDVQDVDPTDSVNPADALEYAIIDGWKARDYQNANITDWDILTTKLVTEVQTGPLPSGKSLAAEKGALEEGQSDYFALAVHMDEKAGNEYMGKELKIDVQVAAKQMAFESDSISNQYDADAEYGDDKWYIPTYESVYAMDFEAEDYPYQNWGVVNNGWITLKDNGVSKGYLVTDEAEAPSGKTYFNIMDGVSDALVTWPANKSPFVSGKEYTFTAMIKVSKDEDGNLPTPQFRLRYYNAAGNQEWATFSEVKEDQWVEVSYTFTAPEGAEINTGRPSLDIYKNADDRSNGNGIIFIDNIQILTEVEIENPTAKEEFVSMLAEEAAVSQMVDNAVLDVYGERERLAGTENLISDGTLSKNEFNVEGSSSWFAREQFLSSGTWVADSHTDDGSGALKLKCNGVNKKPWFYQEIENVPTDVVYQISYWYKIAEGTTGTPYIKIETFADPAIPGNENLTMIYDQIDILPKDGYSADGNWHKVTQNFVVSDGTYIIRVLPRLRDVGAECLFDDFELYMTPPVDMVSVETEFKFFYDDDLGNTTLTAVFNDQYFPEYSDAKVDFQVYDGDKLVWEKKDNTFDQSKATVEFPLTTLAKYEVPYCVKVTLHDNAGNVLDEASDNIFMYTRPEYLTADGVFMANGETPIYPVLGYHVYQEGLFEQNLSKCNEAGINVIQLENNLTNADIAVEQLDACERNGVMGLLNLYGGMEPAGSERNLQYTINVLSDKRVTDHPALFGYLVMDEPFLHDADAYMDMENSYRLIRQYDAKHPIMAVETFDNLDKASKYVDIIIGDYYRPAKGAMVYNFTRDAVEITNGRPTYTLIKAYAYSYAPEAFPTGSDARNNMWQAILAGARGAGYYSIRDAIDIDLFSHDPAINKSKPVWTDQEFWQALCDFGKKEMTLAYDHFVFEKSPDFNENLEGDYWYSSWVVDGNVYMVVLGMNDYGTKVNADIPLTSANGQVNIENGTVEIISGNDSATIVDGHLKLEIEGVDVVLYKITPNEPVDFSVLQ